jgi:hypothetical protein
MILTLLLAIAVLAAVAGACKHNLTSYALLGSFGLSTALCWAGIPFNTALWIFIDSVVIACVLSSHAKRRDWLILALFPPAWAIYFLQPEWAPAAIDVIVAAQMLLTFPARRLGFPLWLRARSTPFPRDPFRDIDRKAYA